MRPPAQIQTLGRSARNITTLTTHTMHIQATRPFWYAGSVVPVGTVLALPTILAAELVHNGKATACAAPAAAPAAPAAAPTVPAAPPADPPATPPAAPAARAKAARKATSPTPLEATP
jgi:hypothetical protein